MKIQELSVGRMSCWLLAFAILQGVCLAEPTPVGKGPFVQEDWLARMRQAGIRGDRSQIPYMLQAFKSPPDSGVAEVAYTVRMSLLMPLARLGAVEALPAFNDVIQSNPEKPLPGQSYPNVRENTEVIAATKVAKARLVAESATTTIADSRARAAAKVTRFYQELGLTPENINAAVALYAEQKRSSLKAAKLVSDSPGPNRPVEIFVLNELADMVYRGRYQDYASLPQVSQVDFRQDTGVALKMRLAAISREQRVTTLITQPPASFDEVPYRNQLLADEGPLARSAILAKRQEIAAHPEQYPNTRILKDRLLEDVLRTIGDQADTAQTPVRNMAKLKKQFVTSY